MLPLQFSRARVQAFLKEIDHLRDSDFPYQGSRDALDSIEQIFQTCDDSLASLTVGPDLPNDLLIIQNACSESLGLLNSYLPLLGFILRSTNVRNSFEVFGPLHRLARQLLGEDTKLILSSEWLLSPHVYPPFSELPHFVLLGLPACESSNPLLLPLAGHELGHTAWKHYVLENEFGPSIRKLISAEVKKREKEYTDIFGGDINDLFVTQNVSAAHAWALKQVEETFCDCMGVRLFAESYLHAFAYLLLPGTMKRSWFYPNTRQRFDNLKLAGKKYNFALCDDYREWFVDQEEPSKGQKDCFLLSLADSAALTLVPEVVAKSASLAEAADAPILDGDIVKRCLSSFRFFTPATGAKSLANILDAGWRVYRDPAFWESASHVPEDRVTVINELVLKSIEVLEIENRTE